MTVKEAQIIGRTKTLKATGIVIGSLLIIFLLMSIISDFGNGIIFFIQALLNVHFLAIMAILFGLTFLFGGRAGKEIIIDNKNYILIAFKYVVLIIIVVIIYAALIGITKDKADFLDNFEKFIVTYFFVPLVKTGSLTIIPMLGIWLWATNQMQLKSTEKKK